MLRILKPGGLFAGYEWVRPLRVPNQAGARLLTQSTFYVVHDRRIQPKNIRARPVQARDSARQRAAGRSHVWADTGRLEDSGI